MRNHYQRLGVVRTAPADEIKRAFRREIARYHPDKVQHLGPEFQDIAATRAAELTEAYRVLMDMDLRRAYDDRLERGVCVEATLRPASAAARAAPAAGHPGWQPVLNPGGPAAMPCGGVDGRFQQERATTSDFVRRVAVARLRDTLVDLAGSASPLNLGGFDVAYLVKPRRTVFRKADTQVRLLARFVAQVDPAAVEEAWPLATKSGTFNGVICLMLIGTGVSPARELGAVISERRRRTRMGAPIVVAVDVRDWEALLPPEAPEIVRQLVHRLRDGAQEWSVVSGKW